MAFEVYDILAGSVSHVTGDIIKPAYNVLSMSEICSAYPPTVGLYFWSAQLCGNEWGPFASWLTGWHLEEHKVQQSDVTQLSQLEKQIEGILQQVRTRKTQLISGAVKALQEEGTDSGVDTYFGLCSYPGRELRHRIDLKDVYKDLMVQKFRTGTANHPIIYTPSWEEAMGGTKKGRLYGFGLATDPLLVLTGSTSTNATSSAGFFTGQVSVLQEEIQELRRQDEARQ